MKFAQHQHGVRLYLLTRQLHSTTSGRKGQVLTTTATSQNISSLFRDLGLLFLNIVLFCLRVSSRIGGQICHRMDMKGKSGQHVRTGFLFSIIRTRGIDLRPSPLVESVHWTTVQSKTSNSWCFFPLRGGSSKPITSPCWAMTYTSSLFVFEFLFPPSY